MLVLDIILVLFLGWGGGGGGGGGTRGKHLTKHEDEARSIQRTSTIHEGWNAPSFQTVEGIVRDLWGLAVQSGVFFVHLRVPMQKRTDTADRLRVII